MNERRIKLGGLDLNLLVALDALLRERNVTRAARRVGLSQPAMSNALRRLRNTFDDALLISTRHGMVPTPRCHALEAPVRQALAMLEAAVQPPAPFDPLRPATHRIAMTDYVGWVVLPRLQRFIREHAPQAMLEVVPLTDFAVPQAQLDRGDVDLAINHFRDVPSDMKRRPLFEETFSCLVRHGHPRIKKRLTLAQYTEVPHVLVAPRGRSRGVVDAALAERGLSRTVATTVPHFLVVPEVVAQSDAIATLAHRVARAYASPSLRNLPPPLPIAGFEVDLVWAAHRTDDTRLQWLRDAVVAATADV